MKVAMIEQLFLVGSNLEMTIYSDGNNNKSTILVIFLYHNIHQYI